MNWPGKIDNILVALNGDRQLYLNIFAKALTLAKNFGSRIWLFHFQEGAMIGQPNILGPGQGQSAQADWMISLIGEAKEHEVPTSMLVAQGPGRETLLRAINDCQADMVILGRTDRGMLNDAVSGLSTYILHNAPPSTCLLFVAADQ